MKIQATKATDGNALFFILIAVALFAALSYAVTKSDRGSGSITREKIGIDAANIIQYAGALQTAAQRLVIANKCNDTQISFENPNQPGLYINPSSPLDKSCHIFDPAGGNVAWRPTPVSTGLNLPYMFSGANRLLLSSHTWCVNAGSICIQTISMFLPIASESLCREINKGLNLPATLAIDKINNVLFTGAYGVGNDLPDDGGNMAGYKGQRGGCLQTQAGEYPRTVGGNYFFFNVLTEKPV